MLKVVVRHDFNPSESTEYKRKTKVDEVKCDGQRKHSNAITTSFKYFSTIRKSRVAPHFRKVEVVPDHYKLIRLS